MSIIFYLLRVSPKAIAQLRADPSLTAGVTGLASAAVWEAFAEEASAHLPEEERARLRAKRIEQRTSSAASMPPEFAEMMKTHEAEKKRAEGLVAAPALCLQKSWDVIEHVLSGDHANGQIVLMGGDQIGGDVGYGPATLREPAAVRELATFLETKGVALVASADMHALRGQRIYGFPDETDTLEIDADLASELRRFFELLNDYVRAAAEADDGLLAWAS